MVRCRHAGPGGTQRDGRCSVRSAVPAGRQFRLAPNRVLQYLYAAIHRVSAPIAAVLRSVAWADGTPAVSGRRAGGRPSRIGPAMPARPSHGLFMPQHVGFDRWRSS